MSLNLPTGIASIIQLFSTLFSTRVWKQAQVLMVGSILATRKRTVSSILEVMGMANEKNFQNYHRVLSRAVWSNLEASRILLMILISIFAASGPIIMGIDDTIERRKGKKIKAKGIYREERTFQPQPVCQSEWFTMVSSDVTSRNTLGTKSLGFAFFHSSSTI